MNHIEWAGELPEAPYTPGVGDQLQGLVVEQISASVPLDSVSGLELSSHRRSHRNLERGQVVKHGQCDGAGPPVQVDRIDTRPHARGFIRCQPGDRNRRPKPVHLFAFRCAVASRHLILTYSPRRSARKCDGRGSSFKPRAL